MHEHPTGTPVTTTTGTIGTVAGYAAYEHARGTRYALIKIDGRYLARYAPHEITPTKDPR